MMDSLYESSMSSNKIHEMNYQDEYDSMEDEKKDADSIDSFGMDEMPSNETLTPTSSPTSSSKLSISSSFLFTSSPIENMKRLLNAPLSSLSTTTIEITNPFREHGSMRTITISYKDKDC